MDASFAKFNDDNIRDWSNYNGVNISGATLKEDVHTMVDVESAITDKNTVIEKSQNKQNIMR
jgi:hypothetical protein